MRNLQNFSFASSSVISTLNKEAIMSDRAGSYKTNLSGALAYQSFCPRPLPPVPPIELDGETVELLVKANKQLALLDGIASRIPNLNLFVSMYIRKEALMSSQIEGTQATLEDVFDPLIRTALIHYQFETIHPFLDGNGRVGRLLITLFLMRKQVLSSPVLYISYFLKKNRIEYYDRMSEVRRTGNFEQWVKFFLQAVHESAEDAVLSIDKLSDLHNRSLAVIHKSGKISRSLAKLLAYLEANPIIEIGKTAEALGVSYNTASASVKKLCEFGMLSQITGNRRNRTFAYSAYLDILRNGT
jgi:Fic family protein